MALSSLARRELFLTSVRAPHYYNGAGDGGNRSWSVSAAPRILGKHAQIRGGCSGSLHGCHLADIFGEIISIRIRDCGQQHGHPSG